MGFEEIWNEYTSSEKDMFQKSVRRLLKQTFIVRDRDYIINDFSLLCNTCTWFIPFQKKSIFLKIFLAFSFHFISAMILLVLVCEAFNTQQQGGATDGKV